jgi:hypothetical protein
VLLADHDVDHGLALALHLAALGAPGDPRALLVGVVTGRGWRRRRATTVGTERLGLDHLLDHRPVFPGIGMRGTPTPLAIHPVLVLLAVNVAARFVDGGRLALPLQRTTVAAVSAITLDLAVAGKVASLLSTVRYATAACAVELVDAAPLDFVGA